MISKNILIGWSSRDVTPKGKVSLRGQFFVRLTEEIHDPLTVTALALSTEDNKEQAIIVSLDAVGVSEYVTSGCRRKLSAELSDFRPENFFISATHTHTAPDQPGILLSVRPELGNEVMSEEKYGDLLVEKITEAAIEAWNSRKPGALSWGKAHAVIGFNRRVSYFDGSTIMYGETDKPEFSHIEGHEDHSIDLLFTYDASRNLSGMIVNVPCPSQCTEAESFISADYWHETKEKIWQKYGKSVYILAQCAAAGDVSPRSMVNREADARMLKLKGYGDNYNKARRQDIAEKISKAIDEVLPLANKDIRDNVEFQHKISTIPLPLRRVTYLEFETAQQNVKSDDERLRKLAGHPPESREYSSVYRMRNFQQRVVDKYQAQQAGKELELPVELHSLRIGDIAMCSNPFEYYLDFGQRIKARSRAIQTFNVQLVGPGTYLPTERAMKGGSYGAYIASTPIGPNGGQIIVEEHLKNIDRMFEEKK